jgi:hypothetical protein
MPTFGAAVGVGECVGVGVGKAAGVAVGGAVLPGVIVGPTAEGSVDGWAGVAPEPAGLGSGPAAQLVATRATTISAIAR